MPGQRLGDLFTVLAYQAWWGYTMRKATWLCFSKVDMRKIEFPYRAHDSRTGPGGDRRRFQVMSKHQRAATVPALAEFLVGAARKAHNAAGNRLAEGKSELTGLLGGPTRSEKE